VYHSTSYGSDGVELLTSHWNVENTSITG